MGLDTEHFHHATLFGVLCRKEAFLLGWKKFISYVGRVA